MSREGGIYARLAECYGELPASGIRRMFALWGFTPVPFCSAFGPAEWEKCGNGDENPTGTAVTCGNRRAGE